MADKRKGRTQSIKLEGDYFIQSLHKSMFINDRFISLSTPMVKSWGKEIYDAHNPGDRWEVKINYERPKYFNKQKIKFDASLRLGKHRKKKGSYRLVWMKAGHNEFAKQLAKDYPQSFIRTIEYHIGEEYYNKKKYSEYDIGGFKEELLIRVKWENDLPVIDIKEFYRVRKGEQLFPAVYSRLNDILIAEYLTSSKQELKRRVNTLGWKKRKQKNKEIKEGGKIYILSNEKDKSLYIGETSRSLPQRYPKNHKHNTIPNWDKYAVIELPPDTTNETRLLIERVLITTGSLLFKNNIDKSGEVFEKNIKLKNRKK
jgi:hypothetical protein